MSPDHIRPTARRELEDFWCESVIAAQTLYKAAVSETKRLRTLSDDMQNPDGAPARSQTLAHERDTRENYIKVLRKFTDLMVRGKFPEDQ
jgi:hypothetical protein